jgi:hypothetical protein
MIEALLAIGAFDADEASEWRGVSSEVAASADVEVGRVVSRAELLLKEAEDAIHAAEDKEAQGMRAWWLAEALREAGVITGQDEDRWSARFEEAEGIDDDDDDDLGPRGPQFLELLRVVEPPVERIDGVRLTSIELYDDGVIVRWHHTLPDAEKRETFGWDEDPDMPHDIEPDLEDDIGTRYHLEGASYGGSDSHGWGDWEYGGRVPHGARTLRLGRDQTEWQIGLA